MWNWAQQRTKIECKKSYLCWDCIKTNERDRFSGLQKKRDEHTQSFDSDSHVDTLSSGKQSRGEKNKNWIKFESATCYIYLAKEEWSTPLVYEVANKWLETFRLKKALHQCDIKSHSNGEEDQCENNNKIWIISSWAIDSTLMSDIYRSWKIAYEKKRRKKSERIRMRNLKSQLIFSTHISSWNVSHSHILASQSSLPSSLRHRLVLSRIYCNLNIWNHDDIFFLLPACLLPHIRATLQRSYEEKRVRLFLLTIPSPSEMIWNTLWIMKLKRASKRECKRKKYEKFINIPARVCCVFFSFISSAEEQFP